MRSVGSPVPHASIWPLTGAIVFHVLYRTTTSLFMWAGDGFPVELLSYDDTRHPTRSAARSLPHLAHLRLNRLPWYSVTEANIFLNAATAAHSTSSGSAAWMIAVQAEWGSASSSNSEM